MKSLKHHLVPFRTMLKPKKKGSTRFDSQETKLRKRMAQVLAKVEGVENRAEALKKAWDIPDPK